MQRDLCAGLSAVLFVILTVKYYSEVTFLSLCETPLRNLRNLLVRLSVNRQSFSIGKVASVLKSMTCKEVFVLLYIAKQIVDLLS